jgi:aryl-alcohol dehydrogenase-like predicted oxidoreductase
LAIAWLLRTPVVTSAIVGARRPEQIEETAAAADWQLTEEEIAAVERGLVRHAAAINRLS